ncbi:VOC family protein [Streptomyces sp. NPDC044780]|uniref:VOC family protein n=1 Tax=Streptomyces luomodiensis TaxID=3026192 RepID=A0ABY9V8A2_9ACTN|nr:MULTISPECIES: VOC family protein [unclassified Streptomyces]WAP60454.1 VOC family protein [Streptomyces sp. S465]WNF01103.1 VOC family protein [Streptomyces sp. SCA4-21]
MTQTLPLRLHHHAWVTDDQEANRVFYEDVLGLPLVATWTESDVLFGAERVYSHCFYGLGDGSVLAFFQFANQADREEFNTAINFTPWRHIAFKVDQETQDGMRRRIAAAGYSEEDAYVIDHGWCVSLYITDPNGLMLEFTIDHPDIEKIEAERRTTAHADLARWLGGDHTSNNPWR